MVRNAMKVETVVAETMSSEMVASNPMETSQTNGEPYGTGESSLETSTGPNSPSGAEKSDPKLSKTCGVCGDKALGNNFNAITCESCKAFFRRNALRTKEFVCPFSNNCKVDAITRRFCQRCRLKKCFDIGMKKEWIMTDDEKKLKKQKIEQNRLKRSSMENSSRSGDDTPAAKVQRSEHSSSSGEEGSEMGSDAVLGSSKVLKQPMGLHNPNKPPARFKKGKDNRANVIASTATSASETSSEVSGEAVFAETSRFSLPPSQSANLPGAYHETSINCTSAVSTQPWNNGASITTTTNVAANDTSVTDRTEVLNQPPPLIKYPGNSKKSKNVKKESVIAMNGDEDEDSANQMPLLSSLIQPGYSESSPDVSSSPPAIPMTLSDRQMEGGIITSSPNGIGVIIKNDSVSGNSFAQNANNHISMTLSHSPPIQSYHDERIIQHNHLSRNPPAPSVPRYVLPDNQVHYSGDSERHSYDVVANQRRHSIDDSRMTNYHQTPERRERPEQEMIPLPPLNTMDSILSVAIAAEFNAFGMLGANSSRELNKAEQAKLNELLVASQALHAPVDAERDIKVSETSDPSLLNVINLTEIAIRRLIKMSKKISGFKNMCQEDQIALLKGGCTEMMILRSAVTYDPLKDSWEIPHSNPGQYNINLGVLKEARGNLYEEHQRFVKSFRSEWRKDENIMIILCAITLFTPERLNVIHKDVVKLEQDSYYYLLKRYLESTLNGCEAKSTYLQLIKKIAELRALNSSHVRVFLEMNPKEVEPLLIEIFDLK